MSEKLVRDKVPALMGLARGDPRLRFAAGEELVAFLLAKLQEEAREVADAPPERRMEELADLREAVDACVRALGANPYQLDKLRWDKQERKGAFRLGAIVDFPGGS